MRIKVASDNNRKKNAKVNPGSVPRQPGLEERWASVSPGSGISAMMATPLLVNKQNTPWAVIRCGQGGAHLHVLAIF